MTPFSLARSLVEHGIPVIVVKGGDNHPADWQQAEADTFALSEFVPGEDALAMVTGHGLDCVDVDKKVNGSIENLPEFQYFGVDNTPGGGQHFIVRSTGAGRRQGFKTDKGAVGDYLGKASLMYLPGSVRPKYPNGGYTIDESWDIAACLAADPDSALVAALDAADIVGYEAHEDRSAARTEPGLHPYAQAAISRELKRLRECQRNGWNGEPWDSTTYAVACTLIEFGNSGWTGYSVRQAHTDLLVNAPADGEFGQAEHEAKWRSARKKVGTAGRRERHDIWDATPILSHIRTAAHARMVGSGSLLGWMLARVMAEVPPEFVLPPVIGGPASLNMAFAMVGRSGDGKSALASVSAELLDLQQGNLETGVGSGEGLIESFLVPDVNDPRRKVVDSPASRVLLVDEIGQLGAVGRRDGSTLMPILRTALTGGSLRTNNATADRTRSVPSGRYRFVALVGVQPDLSDVLLEGVGEGTPQRFVWISATDPTVPDKLPEWPGDISWTAVHIEFADHTEIRYPEYIKEEIIAARGAQVRGENVDPRLGHALLTQLKVAAALAFLHGEIDITTQWWEIAAHIMRWSEKEQLRCLKALAMKKVRMSQSKGKARAVEDDAADSEVYRNARERFISLVSTHKDTTFREVYHRLSTAQCAHAERVMAELKLEGKIKVTETKANNGKVSYRIRERE